MPGQDDLVQAEGVEPGIQVSGVVGEGVADGGLAGAAHPDQVRCQQPPAARPGQHVAPQVRGGRVAVQEDQRRPAAGIAVVDGRVEYVDVGHRDSSSRRARLAGWGRAFPVTREAAAGGPSWQPGMPCPR